MPLLAATARARRMAGMLICRRALRYLWRKSYNLLQTACSLIRVALGLRMSSRRKAIREAFMQTKASVRERLDVVAEEGQASELILRILKLRWIGMEDEAERMELALQRVDPACTLLAGPFDTD